MNDPPIPIIGTGRFARSVLRGITTALDGRMRPVLISRSAESLRKGAAALRDDGVALETALIDPTSDNGLRDWLPMRDEIAAHFRTASQGSFRTISRSSSRS